MGKRFYIAYGSNLNFSQMRYRCPTAKFVGTGMLENYELQFKGHSHSAFATIQEKVGCSVPVGVWELQSRDEKMLDVYEGYPSHYFKADIPVTVGGVEINAMVYIMNLRMQYGMPSTHYYQTLVEGYKDCGMDIAPLQTALQDSTLHFYSSAVGQEELHSIRERDAPEPEEDMGGSFLNGMQM